MMYRLTLLCLALSVLLVDGWPRVVRSQGWYQCCCAEENPDCPAGCFLCRNYIYSCECSTCSCYSGDEEHVIATDVKARPKNDLLHMLLRSGFGGGRFRREADEEDLGNSILNKAPDNERT